MKLVSIDNIPYPKNCRIENYNKIKDLYWKLLRFCIENHYTYMTAVQVGIPLRFYILQYDIGFLGFANAEYDPVDETKVVDSIEGCASLCNGEQVKLKRYKAIRVEGLICHPNYDNFIEFDRKINTKYSLLHQHMIDHQNGVLISNIGHPYVS